MSVLELVKEPRSTEELLAQLKAMQRELAERIALLTKILNINP